MHHVQACRYQHFACVRMPGVECNKKFAQYWCLSVGLQHTLLLSPLQLVTLPAPCPPKQTAKCPDPSVTYSSHVTGSTGTSSKGLASSSSSSCWGSAYRVRYRCIAIELVLQWLSYKQRVQGSEDCNTCGMAMGTSTKLFEASWFDIG